MKIVLVNPNPVYTPNFHLGLIFLAGKLKKAGYDVRIYDFGYFDDYYRAINEGIDKVLDERPNLVGITTRCDDYPVALDVAKKIKEENESIKTVLGGIHATFTAKETLKYFNFIDFIIKGEGEKTIVDLAKTIENNKDISKIKGIFFRDDNENIIETQNQELLDKKELDSLLYLMMDVIESDKVIKLAPFIYKELKRPHGNVAETIVSRGCPFGCRFCSETHMWGRKIRFRSIKNVIAELKFWKKLNFPCVMFQDDTFTASKKYVYDLCSAIKKENLNLDFVFNTRIDQIDSKLLNELSSSNFVSVSFGVESGSQRIQKIINKYPNYDKERIYQVIEETSKYFDMIKCYFMSGFPFETLEDMDQTLDLINMIGKLGRLPILFKFAALPDSDLFNEYKDKLILRDSSNFSLPLFGDIYLKEYRQWIEDHPNLFSAFYSTKFDNMDPDEFENKFLKMQKTVQRYQRTYQNKAKYL